jgi:acyl-lipid omega-6 desaturase (Delta-12 desaturase)
MSTLAPNRKALFASVDAHGTWRPLLLAAADMTAFCLASAVTLLVTSVWLKVLGSFLIAGTIVRLFLIGHDACHGSYFAQKALNHIVGRLVFLPSMTAFSLWDVGHNVAHHGFNNLKGRDQVWTPLSKPEFDSLGPVRRSMERLYRSGFGCGAYYFLELWWKKLYFASRKQIGSGRVQYKIDSLIVTAGMALWCTVVVLVAQHTHQSVWLLLALAVVVPFLLWNCIMGFVVFVHHTHPTIAWFQNRHDWQAARAYLTSTANVRLPFGLDWLMHGIMEHNAHHVNPRIGMFGLRRAQRLLKESHFSEVLSYRLNWRLYTECVRRCKLYDYANHRWLDWRGDVTAQATVHLHPVAS